MKIDKIYRLLPEKLKRFSSNSGNQGKSSHSNDANEQEWKKRVAAADRARDTGRFVDAARLFCHALELRVDRGIHIQAGHMYKESRNFVEAQYHYDVAYSLDPTDREISHQLGHFYKTIKQYEKALAYYQAALDLDPNWGDPAREIAALKNSAELRYERNMKQLQDSVSLTEPGVLSADDITKNVHNALLDGSLLPVPYDDLCVSHQPAFVPTRNGTPQITEWGRGLTVRGISALRGYLVSAVPLDRIDILMDGKIIHSERLTVARQPREKENINIKKYCYNSWVDFTDVEPGQHDFIFRAVAPGLEEVEHQTWRRERLIVAPPFDRETYRNSDAIIAPIDRKSKLSLVEQINSQPSVLHRCNTRSFPIEIRTVAVLRPDQLGDMVASIPALRKIRSALPEAKIVGLLSRANEGLARTLGIFDDIIIVNFPDDPDMHERVMTLENQISLKKELEKYKFDLAVDLPVSANSHKLLPLIQAPLTVGFGGHRKSIDLNFSSYDPTTGCDFVKHSARTGIIGESIALAIDSGARVMRRDDLSREMLVPYGIFSSDPYIVIHSGARIKFTHWPYYTKLAERIAREMGVRVVYMAENEDQKAKISSELLESGMIVYVSGQIPFDHFDAFLSFSTVFVGNDSGPKHLASLRGTEVVSLHSSVLDGKNGGRSVEELPSAAVFRARAVPCIIITMNAPRMSPA
ncbi:glycosyltransferase family 9 protein [Komagataeibacter kakiaceti]|uniref:glycosyltransferase family 9 protein n=1 Tax=Komagataeibacter kakiaceti TaxID=943261 RepID=UPI0009FDAA2A|nr:glycosyltransferase family 9 protein [Komagataeibacter kakiaceti]